MKDLDVNAMEIELDLLLFYMESMDDDKVPNMIDKNDFHTTNSYRFFERKQKLKHRSKCIFVPKTHEKFDVSCFTLSIVITEC